MGCTGHSPGVCAGMRQAIAAGRPPRPFASASPDRQKGGQGGGGDVHWPRCDTSVASPCACRTTGNQLKTGPPASRPTPHGMCPMHAVTRLRLGQRASIRTGWRVRLKVDEGGGVGGGSHTCGSCWAALPSILVPGRPRGPWTHRWCVMAEVGCVRGKPRRLHVTREGQHGHNTAHAGMAHAGVLPCGMAKHGAPAAHAARHGLPPWQAGLRTGRESRRGVLRVPGRAGCIRAVLEQGTRVSNTFDRSQQPPPLLWPRGANLADAWRPREPAKANPYSVLAPAPPQTGDCSTHCGLLAPRTPVWHLVQVLPPATTSSHRLRPGQHHKAGPLTPRPDPSSPAHNPQPSTLRTQRRLCLPRPLPRSLSLEPASRHRRRPS